MREILFRGKRLNNDEWVYGYYSGPVGIVSSHEICDINDPTGCMLDVDPATVGQYTGLNDSNGKKIFEGDILTIAKIMDGMETYYSPAIKYPVNVVVKWDLCAWMWETIAEDKRYITFPDAWCHYECKVIGNIHDNPELMGGTENEPLRQA